MEQDTRPVVGFIGIGAIGRPMAERIARNGYRLVAFDTNPAAVAALEVPFEAAKDAADLANRADIVVACLATPESHLDAIAGEHGIVQGTRATSATASHRCATPGINSTPTSVRRGSEPEGRR